jgi:drug/metabolite transporter superfamily protein YnfA
MGVGGVVFALFAVGYILGAWTAFMVLRQPQGAYEDAVSAIRLSVPVVLVQEGEAHRVTRRS